MASGARDIHSNSFIGGGLLRELTRATYKTGIGEHGIDATLKVEVFFQNCRIAQAETFFVS